MLKLFSKKENNYIFQKKNKQTKLYKKDTILHNNDYNSLNNGKQDPFESP